VLLFSPAVGSRCVSAAYWHQGKYTNSGADSVSTTTLSIPPNSIFIVGSYARGAIATSSVSSGLGIACDVWFLLRYNWTSMETCMVRLILASATTTFILIYCLPLASCTRPLQLLCLLLNLIPSSNFLHVRLFNLTHGLPCPGGVACMARGRYLHSHPGFLDNDPPVCHLRHTMEWEAHCFRL